MGSWDVTTREYFEQKSVQPCRSIQNHAVLLGKLGKTSRVLGLFCLAVCVRLCVLNFSVSLKKKK